MKKFLGFLALSAFLFVSSSFTVAPAHVGLPVNASKVMLPIGKTGGMVSLMDISKMPVSELENLTGQKMGFFKKLAMKKALHGLARGIDKDGNITNKKLLYLFSASSSDVTSGFHLGGFALGLFLSLIGVLIAYLIKTGDTHGRIKWAWIGAAAGLVLWLIFRVLL